MRDLWELWKREPRYVSGLASESAMGIPEEFLPHYHKHLAPVIEEYEQQRIAYLQKMRGLLRKYLPLALIGLAAFLFVPFLWFLPALLIWKLPSFIRTNFNYTAQEEVNYTVQEEIYRRIFSYFGEDFSYRRFGGMSKELISLARAFDHVDVHKTDDNGSIGQDTADNAPQKALENIICKSGAAPSFHIMRLDDMLTGSHEGVGLQLSEIVLLNESHQKGGRREHIVFQGLAILLDMNKSFAQRTLILRDGGMFRMLKGFTLPGSVEPVTLEDPIFQEKFDVYSDDQVEARYLITPSFMERFLELEVILQARSIQASFFENRLLLLIETSHDYFKAGTVFETLNIGRDVRTILAEMRQIFSIIETLKLYQQTRL